MTQQEHFNRSVAVLVKAFFTGQLNEMNCAACACGNLIAAANGYIVAGWNEWLNQAGESVKPMWKMGPNRAGGPQVLTTGYTEYQFERIEAAFMDDLNERDFDSKQDRDFAGLMAVVDVLADIHGIDLATAEVAKGLFVKA